MLSSLSHLFHCDITDVIVFFAGTVTQNTQAHCAVCLTVTFHNYDQPGPITYPCFEKVQLKTTPVNAFIRNVCAIQTIDTITILMTSN